MLLRWGKEVHRCFVCKVGTATGIRLPGSLSGLEERLRRYQWYCGQHEAEALAWQRQAMEKFGLVPGSVGKQPSLQEYDTSVSLPLWSRSAEIRDGI